MESRGRWATSIRPFRARGQGRGYFRPGSRPFRGRGRGGGRPRGTRPYRGRGGPPRDNSPEHHDRETDHDLYEGEFDEEKEKGRGSEPRDSKEGTHKADREDGGTHDTVSNEGDRESKNTQKDPYYSNRDSRPPRNFPNRSRPRGQEGARRFFARGNRPSRGNKRSHSRLDSPQSRSRSKYSPEYSDYKSRRSRSRSRSRKRRPRSRSWSRSPRRKWSRSWSRSPRRRRSRSHSPYSRRSRSPWVRRSRSLSRGRRSRSPRNRSLSSISSKSMSSERSKSSESPRSVSPSPETKSPTETRSIRSKSPGEREPGPQQNEKRLVSPTNKQPTIKKLVSQSLLDESLEPEGLKKSRYDKQAKVIHEEVNKPTKKPVSIDESIRITIGNERYLGPTAENEPSPIINKDLELEKAFNAPSPDNRRSRKREHGKQEKSKSKSSRDERGKDGHSSSKRKMKNESSLDHASSKGTMDSKKPRKAPVDMFEEFGFPLLPKSQMGKSAHDLVLETYMSVPKRAEPPAPVAKEPETSAPRVVPAEVPAEKTESVGSQSQDSPALERLRRLRAAESLVSSLKADLEGSIEKPSTPDRSMENKPVRSILKKKSTPQEISVSKEEEKLFAHAKLEAPYHHARSVEDEPSPSLKKESVDLQTGLIPGISACENVEDEDKFLYGDETEQSPVIVKDTTRERDSLSRERNGRGDSLGRSPHQRPEDSQSQVTDERSQSIYDRIGSDLEHAREKGAARHNQKNLAERQETVNWEWQESTNGNGQGQSQGQSNMPQRHYEQESYLGDEPPRVRDSDLGGHGLQRGQPVYQSSERDDTCKEKLPDLQATSNPSSIQPQDAAAITNDPTIKNILKSIGFNFELSQLMQEKARKEREKKEKEDSSPEVYGVKEGSSFLSGGLKDLDLALALEPERKHLEPSGKPAKVAKRPSIPDTKETYEERARRYREEQLKEYMPDNSAPAPTRVAGSEYSNQPIHREGPVMIDYGHSLVPYGGDLAGENEEDYPAQYDQYGQDYSNYPESRQTWYEEYPSAAGQDPVTSGASRVSALTVIETKEESLPSREVQPLPKQKGGTWDRAHYEEEDEYRRRDYEKKYHRDHARERRSRSRERSDSSGRTPHRTVLLPKVEKMSELPGDRKNKDSGKKRQDASRSPSTSRASQPVRLSRVDREKLLREMEERKKRQRALERELERLHKQQNELMRKRQRQKDGHKDPLLAENSKLQEEISSQISMLRQAGEENAKMLGAKGSSIKDEDSDSSLKKKQESIKQESEVVSAKSKYAKKLEKMDYERSEQWEEAAGYDKREEEPPRKAPVKVDAPIQEEAKLEHPKDVEKEEPDIRHEYFDPGNHWCRQCNHVSSNVYEVFSHLQSKKHQQKLDPYDRPWMPDTLQNPSNTLKHGRAVVAPFKGVEFVMSTHAFYCSLCDAFSGDVTCAEEHLKSPAHNAKYMKYIEENTFYERRYNLDRAAGLSQMRGSHKADDLVEEKERRESDAQLEREREERDVEERLKKEKEIKERHRREAKELKDRQREETMGQQRKIAKERNEDLIRRDKESTLGVKELDDSDISSCKDKESSREKFLFSWKGRGLSAGSKGTPAANRGAPAVPPQTATAAASSSAAEAQSASQSRISIKLAGKGGGAGLPKINPLEAWKNVKSSASLPRQPAFLSKMKVAMRQEGKYEDGEKTDRSPAALGAFLGIGPQGDKALPVNRGQPSRAQEQERGKGLLPKPSPSISASKPSSVYTAACIPLPTMAPPRENTGAAHLGMPTVLIPLPPTSAPASLAAKVKPEIVGDRSGGGGKPTTKTPSKLAGTAHQDDDASSDGSEVSMGSDFEILDECDAG